MDLRDIKEFLRDCWSYIITVAIIVFVFTFIVACHPIAGNSMTPTLEEGNIVVVSKLSHKLFKINRNQIVIIKKGSKTYVKRVIGLPGENISYLNNVLYVDGEAHKEDFLENGTITNNFLLEDICSQDECPNNVIPSNHYLVLGDNRSDSKDSREFGLIEKSEINGIVWINIWPINDMKFVK